jgi:type II secretory ATPase GspE/PulE/Tfp pilus assembly ATPase PilB-like protein
MADLSSPLQWETVALPRTEERPVREAFRWPTPPAAGYALATPQADPLPCEIVGHNDLRRRGRLTFFVPEEGVAHVQVLPARTTLPLRFDQFRALVVTDTLKPEPPRPEDPHAGLLGQEPRATYRVQLATGTTWAIESVGHAESEVGLFLFPPVVGGGVQRLFVPRSAYVQFEVGARIGEILLEQETVSVAVLDEAVQQQEELRERKLGDVLLERRVVSAAQLEEALAHQSRMPMVRIGEALRSLGMIDDRQLALALQQQQADRSLPLGEVLVRMNAVSRADLRVALARKMGFPVVDVDAFPVEADALRKIKFESARKLELLPLLVRGGRLVVALDDPVRRHAAVLEAEFSAQMKVVPVIAVTASIDDVIVTAYQRIGATANQPAIDMAPLDLAPPELELRSDALVETLERENAGRLEDEKPIEQSDNSLVRLIHTMIVEAIGDGVSDIHVEAYPGREKIRIRFRKDGLMRTYLELPHTYRSAVVARLKIMCDLDISERRKPQDGKINFAKFSPQHRVELRVATIPTNNGLEDVVMRILSTARPLPLDRLGLSEWNYTQLRAAIERPYGLVLCVGPTGSGKTTTLHSALSHINVPERKIWTAEDPIEITQPGLRQVQVNPKIDWTFAKALRALLRADPDTIMIGEVRDAETGQIAVEASLTGHLVMSTLHTNSAPETVTRLLDMGLDPFNFADALLAVLAQRLVRRQCRQCLTSRPATQAEIDELLSDHLHAWGNGFDRPSPDDVLAGWQARHAKDGRLMAHAGAGCAACGGTGYKGRVAIHELMVVTRELRRMVQTGERAAELQRVAMSEGMRTLRQDGIEKVLAGLTSIEEVRATSNG